VTDARGKMTVFEYDLAGRLSKEINHLGKFSVARGTMVQIQPLAHTRISQQEKEKNKVAFEPTFPFPWPF